MNTIISVIIPVYNGEKTIKETVESVLNQIFDQFELIIINADSTDSTLEIISQIQDPRIKVFTYPKANACVNRNRGFRHSIGEFITFLDADDLWTPNKLEAQYNALIEKPQAAVVYSWTKCIDENGKPLSITWPRVQWTGDVYDKFLLFDFIGSGSNTMIRRNAFEATGGFDESLCNAQDTDMSIRLAANYDFIVVPQLHIFYRISPISLSSDFLGFEKSALQVITRAYNHPKAASFQHLKHHSIANLYKYLSYKALNLPPGKQKTLQVLKVLIKSIRTDVKLITKPIIYKAFLKLLAMTLLPPEWAKSLFKKFPRLGNTSTFLSYGKSS